MSETNFPTIEEPTLEEESSYDDSEDCYSDCMSDDTDSGSEFQPFDLEKYNTRSNCLTQIGESIKGYLSSEDPSHHLLTKMELSRIVWVLKSIDCDGDLVERCEKVVNLFNDYEADRYDHTISFEYTKQYVREMFPEFSDWNPIEEVEKSLVSLKNLRRIEEDIEKEQEEMNATRQWVKKMESTAPPKDKSFLRKYIFGHRDEQKEQRKRVKECKGKLFTNWDNNCDRMRMCKTHVETNVGIIDKIFKTFGEDKFPKELRKRTKHEMIRRNKW